MSVLRSSRWMWMLLALWALSVSGVRAEEEFRFSVQAVQASERGKNADNPQIAPVLNSFAPQLKGLGYGKYEDLGKSNANAKAGQSTQVAVGGNTVTVQVLKVDGHSATINVTIEGKGQNPMKLKPGSPNLIEIGNAARPVILIFSTEK